MSQPKEISTLTIIGIAGGLLVLFIVLLVVYSEKNESRKPRKRKDIDQCPPCNCVCEMPPPPIPVCDCNYIEKKEEEAEEEAEEDPPSNSKKMKSVAGATIESFVKKDKEVQDKEGNEKIYFRFSSANIDNSKRSTDWVGNGSIILLPNGMSKWFIDLENKKGKHSIVVGDKKKPEKTKYTKDGNIITFSNAKGTLSKFLSSCLDKHNNQKYGVAYLVQDALYFKVVNKNDTVSVVFRKKK